MLALIQVLLTGADRLSVFLQCRQITPVCEQQLTCRSVHTLGRDRPHRPAIHHPHRHHLHHHPEYTAGAEEVWRLERYALLSAAKWKTVCMMQLVCRPNACVLSHSDQLDAVLRYWMTQPMAAAKIL